MQQKMQKRIIIRHSTIKKGYKIYKIKQTSFTSNEKCLSEMSA